MKVEIVFHVALVISVLATVVVALSIAWGEQEPRSASLEGWRISYVAAGSGDGAVVFVHGATSSSAAFRAQLDQLSVGRRLLAVDLIGHGDSDKPETDYTMQLFARSVAAAMDAEGIERAVLVGHSNGVPTAREFYRMFPERTEALVMLDGAFRQTISAPVADWMRNAFDRPDFEEFRVEMARQMPTFSLTADDVERIRADALRTPKHVMVGELESILDPAIWAEDPIAVPMLVVLAEQPTWTPDDEALIRRLAPHVEYHVWDNVSHFLMLERAESFNELLADFIARLANGS